MCRVGRLDSHTDSRLMGVCCYVTIVDGVPLPEGRWRIIGSGNLQLSDVVASDTAEYVCTLHEASLTAAASLDVYGMCLLTFETNA